jgi:diguanylate cyclase (GGDEF)-like protein
MDELEMICQWIEHAPHAIAVYQYVEGKVKTICVSDGLYAMMHSPDEPDKAALIQRYATNMYRNTVPEDAARVAYEAKRFAKEGGKYEVFYREKVYQQDVYTMTHSIGYHYFLKDGRRIAIIFYTNLDSAVDQHLQTILENDASFQSFLDFSNLAIAVVKKGNGELLYCNQPMYKLVKPVHNFDTGMTLSEFIKGREDPTIMAHLAQMEGKNNQLVRIDNTTEEVVMHVTTMEWEHEDVYLIESAPWDRLSHDALTGLPNMSWLVNHANKRIQQLRVQRQVPAFIYTNLYGMKGYNNQFGFAQGDRILKALAYALKEIFGDEWLCRSSEDHFMVLTSAQGLDEKLDVLCGCVQKASRGNFLKLKLGIYVADDQGKEHREISVSEAFDMARLACSTIKENARRSWAYFNGKVSEEYENRLYILDHFQEAMDKGWIEVYYQPIYQVHNQTLTSFECLARWNDPIRGLLRPSKFVPVLEQYHLVGLLDRYILEKICQQALLRKQRGFGDIPVSYNVSRDDFNYTDVFEEVCETTAKYGMDHHLIHVEITESAFSDDPEFIGQQVKRFRNAGFHVWMDDFGSEYSSLGTLQTMDVNLVKLDIRFLRGCEEEKEGHRAIHLLQSTIQLLKALGLHTLCEGVETQAQLELLKEAGCEKAQGFYLGKPQRLEDI